MLRINDYGEVEPRRPARRRFPVLLGWRPPRRGDGEREATVIAIAPYLAARREALANDAREATP